jgi:hypothetical protein
LIDVRLTALAHHYFLRFDTCAPKQVEAKIDLSDVGMWCNLWADEFGCCVPDTVQVIAHQVEPTDGILVLPKLKVLQVPVRGWKGDGVAVSTVELVLDILGELHVIGRILCFTSSIICTKSASGCCKVRNSATHTSGGIFPVQIHSIEAVGVHELHDVVDECFTILRCASHVTEG